MFASFSSVLRFHVTRLFRLQPAVLLSLACAVVFLLIAAIVCLYQWRAVLAANERWEELRSTSKQKQAAENLNVSQEVASVVLPKFHSGQLVSSLNHFAADNKLALEEVVYTLDESTSQPYLRYRINMSVTSSYPVVRRFAMRLNSKMPTVVLDAINCSREDIAIAALKCDLSFSAFFQKEVHG